MLQSGSNRKEREKEKEVVVNYFGILSWHLPRETESHVKPHDTFPGRDTNLTLPKYKSITSPIESALLGAHLDRKSGICFLK
jgi:hypothetical protein